MLKDIQTTLFQATFICLPSVFYTVRNKWGQQIYKCKQYKTIVWFERFPNLVQCFVDILTLYLIYLALTSALLRQHYTSNKKLEY